MALGPALGSQATWSKARVPTTMDVSSPHWSRPRVRTPHSCLVTFLRSPPWNGLRVTGGASWPHSPPCVAQPQHRSHPWPLSSTFTSCYLPQVTRLGSRPGSDGEQCSPVRWRTEAWITPYRWTGKRCKGSYGSCASSNARCLSSKASSSADSQPSGQKAAADLHAFPCRVAGLPCWHDLLHLLPASVRRGSSADLQRMVEL